MQNLREALAAFFKIYKTQAFYVRIFLSANF